MATHTGTIKSFGFNKGYGFILSDEMPGEEIFFSKRNLPRELNDAINDRNTGITMAGKQVTFSMETNNAGKPQASQIKLVASDGDQLVGKIKSYNQAKGYGFLESASIVGQDIFFMRRELNPAFADAPLTGMSASFTLTMASDGKPQAKMVSPSPGGKGGCMGGMGGWGDCKGGKGGKGDCWGGCGGMGGMWVSPMMALPSPNGKGCWGKGGNDWGKGGGNDWGKGGGWGKGGDGGWGKGGDGGQRDKAMFGMVKSYNDAKGFGFINTPQIPADIYFKGMGQSFSQGQTVSFYLNLTPDGKAQARNVSMGLSEGEMAMGSVKSYNAAKGFGFIEVPDKPGDVYFKKEQVPDGFKDEQLAGRQVQFTAHFSPDGKAQVAHMEFMDGSAGVQVQQPAGGVKRSMGNWNNSQQQQPAKRMRVESGDATGMEIDGTVKSYNQAKGWGFITSDHLPQDVYFKGQYANAVPGNACRFSLIYTPDGKPQAQNVQF